MRNIKKAIAWSLSFRAAMYITFAAPFFGWVYFVLAIGFENQLLDGKVSPVVVAVGLLIWSVGACVPLPFWMTRREPIILFALFPIVLYFLWQYQRAGFGDIIAELLESPFLLIPVILAALPFAYFFAALIYFFIFSQLRKLRRKRIALLVESVAMFLLFVPTVVLTIFIADAIADATGNELLLDISIVISGIVFGPVIAIPFGKFLQQLADLPSRRF